MIDRLSTFYENYDEDGRLTRDNVHLVEWLTTIRYLNRLLLPNSKILDACAGAGRYSFYLAEKGHRVTACDLVEHNVSIIKSKPEAARLADAVVCNVLDMSRFEDNSFDVVLCMGALYHLPTDAEKTQAIRECTRVCTPGGLVVLAYLNHFAVVAQQLQERFDFFEDVLAEFEDSSDIVFKTTTPSKMEGYAKSVGLELLHNIGVDGVSYILSEKVNTATDAAFEKWTEYIFEHCEEPSILGYSMHGLLVGKKPVAL